MNLSGKQVAFRNVSPGASVRRVLVAGALAIWFLLFPGADSWAESKVIAAGKASRARLKQERLKRIGAAAVPADAVDSIVAVVDGEPVAMSDLHSYLLRHKDSIKAAQEGLTTEEILRRGNPVGKRILEDLIQEIMLGKEAQAAGISATAEEINSYISEVRRQNRVDEKTFDEILASRGISREKYLEQVKDDIVRARIVSGKVRSKINVLDDEIRRAARKSPDGTPAKDKVHLEQILLRATSGDSDDLEDLMKKARSLREDADEAASLKEVDEENYSDLGAVRPTDLRPELEKMARRLEPGKITPVVCYDSVCAILRRIPDEESAKNAEAEEAPVISDSEREALRKQLFEEKFQLALDRYLKVELPEKYQVETKW